jgi:hypothetical protein
MEDNRIMKKGFIHSEETKQKMREKKLGRKHTPETIEKLKAKAKERYTKEFKQAIRQRFKDNGHPRVGKTHSEETKQKMSKAHALRWQKRKSEGIEIHKEERYLKL